MNYQNYALKDIISISCSRAGKHVATIRDIKNGSFTNGMETIWATGTNDQKLAGFKTNETATFAATSGAVSDGGFVLNGANVKISSDATGYQISQVIKLDSATTAVLKHKATGTAGSEIGYIYGCDSKGNIDPVKEYEQAAEASATKFSFVAATKTITLPTSAFAIGDYILVKYMPTFSELKEISRDSECEPFEGEVRINVFVKELCSNDIYLGQIVFPNGRFDGNYELAFGDAAAVMNFNFEAQAGCDDVSTYWYFYIVDEENIDNA